MSHSHMNARFNSFRQSLRIDTVCLVFLVSLLLDSHCHAQRDLTKIPTPDPIDEANQMKLDELASLNLFAADPDIRKPIQINFDASGALWVATSEIYPQIMPGEEADDRIVVLKDTDNDGVVDKATTFADGLLIPTGVVPDGLNAAYVADSTQLLYLADTNGDGIADQRRVIFSGFGTEDTHHLLHTLRWGNDGHLYFNQSIYIHSHIDTAYGTRHLDGGGIWRYHPGTGRLEVYCKGFINPWGHTFNEAGESFVTDGAFFEGINFAFPDAVFITSPGAIRWLKGLNPGSPKHCGLDILSGTHIPAAWQGDLITSDFRSHRVCRFSVKTSGSGFISRQQPEILTTSHVAFRPIGGRMGPDGAIYIADWYNPIIQHGEVDFRDERRDRKHGRIWRISFPNRELDRWPNFASSSTATLIGILEDPSLAARQFAREELWRRVGKSATHILQLMRHWRDAAGTTDKKAKRSLEVLWMHEATASNAPEGVADDIRFALNAGKGGRTLATILRSAWNLHSSVNQVDTAQIEQAVLSHTSNDDPRIRLEAVICAGKSSGKKALESLIKAIDKPIDNNLDFALWQSLRSVESMHPRQSSLQQVEWSSRTRPLAYAVKAINTPKAASVALGVLHQKQNESDDSHNALVDAIATAGDAAQLEQLLEWVLLREPSDLRSGFISKLVARTKADKTIPQNAAERLRQSFENIPALVASESWCEAICNAATLWKVVEIEPKVIGALEQTNHYSSRAALIRLLGSLPSQSAKESINELVGSDDVSTQICAIRAVMNRRPEFAISASLNLIHDKSAVDEATKVLTELMKQKEMSVRIAGHISKRPLDVDIARRLLRTIRSAGGEQQIENAIRLAGKLEDASWKMSRELSKKILAKIPLHGSASRGEEIYRRKDLQCINCHAIGESGGLVGPNLISIGGSSQPDYILESLIAPNAKLKEGFATLSVLTDDGKIINGIVLAKNDQTIKMRLADGKEAIVQVDLIEEEMVGKSLMPEGMLDDLSEQELVDMVAFLSELGRTPDFTVPTSPVIRSAHSLIYTAEANHRINRTSTDTVASEDPAFTWQPLTSWVNGTFRVEDMDTFRQHRSTPPTSFLRFTVNVPDGSQGGIRIPTDAMEAWVDGKPMPVWKLENEAFSPGSHQVLLSIDRTRQTTPFRIELVNDATSR